MTTAIADWLAGPAQHSLQKDELILTRNPYQSLMLFFAIQKHTDFFVRSANV
jgi:hypothetical protein